jgi:alkylglycerol monooxygenase
MDGPDYIALAIPLFFVGIAIELIAARWKKRVVYHFADAITDLASGVTQQVVGFFAAALLLGIYVLVYEHARLVTFAASSPVMWGLAFLGVDCAYYWWHRLSHEVNFMWAVHVVHHSSEDYNLAVALRQAVFSDLTVTPFYLVLAVAGVSPLAVITVRSLSTLYQFWIHTELIGKLGPVDRWINTPSSHRVHHGVNARYLDRNYAAVLMIWDRLFGSYEPEGEPCVFGISKPLRSFNPLWVQLHYWNDLFHVARQAPSLWQGLETFFRSPAWRPPWMPLKPSSGAAPTPETFVKYAVTSSPRLNVYVAVQFAFVVAATFVLLMFGGGMAWSATAALAILVVLALIAWGGLFESKAWAPALEGVRLAATLAAAAAWVWTAGVPSLWLVPVGVVTLGSAYGLVRARASAQSVAA